MANEGKQSAMTEGEMQSLVGYLAKHDAECPMCRYSLRGLESDRCPECGEHLRLTVGLVEPKMAGWIAGLVGLAGGVGFNGLVLTWGLFMIVRQGGVPLSDLVPLVIGLLVTGVGALIWIDWRSKIRRMPPARRLGIVLAIYVVVFAMAFVFFMQVD